MCASLEMEVFIMTVSSLLKFFSFIVVFMCIFSLMSFFLFEARRCLHVYNICLSWFLIMLPHGICSFSLCDVRPDIFAQFLSFYLEIYKYILYPMLSYRFIADIAIFLWYYKLYAFCSVQRNNILWNFPLISTNAMLIKCLINICVLFCVFLDLCILWWSENFVFILVTNVVVLI